MIRDLVVSLSIRGNEDPARDYAIALAREFGAHLAAVGFAYEPVPASVLADDAPPEWFYELREQAEQSAKTAVECFNEMMRASSILSEARVLSTSAAGAADLFGRIARRFDLAVVRQTGDDESTADPMIIQSALFNSGRPVLVVPYGHRAPFKLDRIMICWDGGSNAARAIADAMPLLERSKAVEVVIVGDRPKSRELPGADVASHLARHGLKVSVDELVAPDVDAASVILSHAANSSADLMVMGAFGHSRLREFVLGGVTRSILAAMTIPTLMAH